METGAWAAFCLNVMLASGGYPWTIIPLERRNDYMAALEAASVGQDVRPFARFVGGLVDASFTVGRQRRCRRVVLASTTDDNSEHDVQKEKKKNMMMMVMIITRSV